MVATGWPETSTRGFGALGIAWPPWLHNTVAPRWSKGPGIAVLRYTMVNAPALTVTVGPVITIDAPFPFWM